ncbi:MAG: acyltransferase [Bacteroidota bacterium]|nr:acyltransferase [Bacteroidota bacterium]MDQ6889030.1 acyltransferase [Bacteroidota bacterium]
MKIYFKNLDGLRFIAALFVILEHVSEYKALMTPGYSNAFKFYFFDLGRYGVTLFFVLSGFLITYLLFSELKQEHTISIKKFYVRRMLRIWPIYLAFGTLIICLIDFVLNKTDGNYHSTPVLTNLAYLYTFTINFQLLFAAYNRGIFEIAWSICVEEQFYIIWPWIVKLGYKRIHSLILIFILIGIVTGASLHLLSVEGILHTNRNPVYIFTVCRFSHLGIGAYAAFVLFHKERFHKIIALTKNKIFQAIVILFVLLLSFRIVELPGFIDGYFLDVIPALFFGLIILSAVSGNFLCNLENRWLKLFGKYSYGLYIFHPSIAQLTLMGFKKFFRNSFFTYDVLYVLVVVILSITMAALSYNLFEKRFLKLKRSYTIIKNQSV